jgi:hypothetical protein
MGWAAGERIDVMDMNYYTMEVVGRERLEALWAEADWRSRIQAERSPPRARGRLRRALVRIGAGLVACTRSLATR